MATDRHIDMAAKGPSRPTGKELGPRMEHLVTRYDGPDGAPYEPDARRVVAACAAITRDRTTVLDVAAILGVHLDVP